MLDQLQLAALPDSERERYMALERLFEQPGWTFVKDWAATNVEAFRQRAWSAQSWDQFLVARAAGSIYELISKLPDTVVAEYTAIASAELEKIEVDTDNEDHDEPLLEDFPIDYEA